MVDPRGVIAVDSGRCLIKRSKNIVPNITDVNGVSVKTLHSLLSFLVTPTIDVEPAFFELSGIAGGSEDKKREPISSLLEEYPLLSYPFPRDTQGYFF